CDVTLVARAPHVDAVNRDGLRLVGVETVTQRLRASTTVDDIPPRALVLLTTKVNGNRAAAAQLADRVREDTVIVCVQNGLASEEIVKDVIGDRCLVLRAITQFGAIFQSPGVIDYKVAGYTLLERHPRSGDLAALFTACGLDGRISDDIRIEVWRK